MFQKISRRLSICIEKANEDILAKYGCKCSIWVTDLGTIHGRVLPNFFSLNQTMKSWGISSYDEEPSNKTTQKPIKKHKKSHTNQLISGKFCRLPATTTCPSPLLGKVIVLVWVFYLQSSRSLQQTTSLPLTVFFLALRQGPEFDFC